jgi:prepilin-type N-terminal cleavage/methylation domain-containing protein
MRIQANRDRTQAFTLVEIMIVVTIIGLLMAIAIPNFVKTRANAQRDICIEQLTKIEQAKQIWGVEIGKNDGDIVERADIEGYLKTWPVCPGGGDPYEINPIGTPASCNVPGHEIQ